MKRRSLNITADVNATAATVSQLQTSSTNKINYIPSKAADLDISINSGVGDALTRKTGTVV